MTQNLKSSYCPRKFFSLLSLVKSSLNLYPTDMSPITKMMKLKHFTLLSSFSLIFAISCKELRSSKQDTPTPIPTPTDPECFTVTESADALNAAPSNELFTLNVEDLDDDYPISEMHVFVKLGEARYQMNLQRNDQNENTFLDTGDSIRVVEGSVPLFNSSHVGQTYSVYLYHGVPDGTMICESTWTPTN